MDSGGEMFSKTGSICNSLISKDSIFLTLSLDKKNIGCPRRLSRESYFHDGIGGFGRDRGYGVLAGAYSNANLIEDNIFHTLDGGFMMAAGGAPGMCLPITT
jgi:hypothetical protein